MRGMGDISDRIVLRIGIIVEIGIPDGSGGKTCGVTSDACRNWKIGVTGRVVVTIGVPCENWTAISSAFGVRSTASGPGCAATVSNRVGNTPSKKNIARSISRYFGLIYRRGRRTSGFPCVIVSGASSLEEKYLLLWTFPAAGQRKDRKKASRHGGRRLFSRSMRTKVYRTRRRIRRTASSPETPRPVSRAMLPGSGTGLPSSILGPK